MRRSGFFLLLPPLLLCLPANAQDGTLDPSFGNDGRVTLHVGSSTTETAHAVALSPDGKVVVAGEADGANGVAITRLLPDGSPDPSFGWNGRVSLDVAGSTDHVGGMLVQPDGRIVVVGYAIHPGAEGWRPFVARFTLNGLLDPDFGTNGLVELHAAEGTANHVAIDASGRLVVTGLRETDNVSENIVARLLPGGALDASFGSGGIASVETSPDVAMSAVTVDAAGRVVVAGHGPRTGANYPDFAVLRLTEAGALDSSFGNGGVATAGWGSQTGAMSSALVIDATGRIVVGGTHGDDVAVARFTDAGIPDVTFDSDGRATYGIFGVQNLVTDIELDAEGRILVTGFEITFSAGQDIAVRRLTVDGSPDPAFGPDGRRTLDLGSRFDYAYGLTVRPDGRPIVAGATQRPLPDNAPNHYDFAVVQFTTDGALDASFGSAGIALIGGVGVGPTAANATVALPDGRVMLAGEATVNGINQFAAARLTADGTPDPSFGDGGRLRIPFGTNAASYAAALQPDGRVLLAGRAHIPGSPPGYGFGVVRLHSDGTLDPTFGSGGRATVVFPSFSMARAMAVQPDGRIVLVGPHYSAESIAVARLHADGSPDLSFDGDGQLTLEISEGSTFAETLALDSAGRILIAVSPYVDGDDPMVAIRLLADGSLDSSFGDGGRVTVTFAGWDAIPHGVVVQADESVVMAGTVDRTGRGSDMAAVRLLPTGALDTSFGDNGRVQVDFGGNDYGSAVVVDDEERLVMAGNAFGVEGYDFAVARLQPDGTLDSGFGQSGRVTIDFTGRSDGARALAFDGLGRIVVAGTAGEGGEDGLAVVRLLAGDGVSTGPGVEGEALRLTAAPNPIRERGSVVLILRESGAYRVEVFDLLGRKVMLLHDGPLSAGAHPWTLDSATLPAGSYLIRVVGEHGQAVRPVTIAG